MSAPNVVAPAAAAAAAAAGEAVLLDLRAPDEFAAAYPRGAICVPYSERRLAERVATVVDGDRAELILVGPSDSGTAAVDVADAATQLEAGAFRVRGVLEGGVAGWQAAGLPLEQLPELEVAELGATDTAVVLDVREPMEWATGYVPGATLIRLAELPDRLQELPRDRRVDVLCEAGIRSITAASLLRAAGVERVTNVAAGTAGYRASGRPLEYPAEQPS